ncbi:MAG: hypothetical protein ACRYFX_16955 [Janthinobacterium lividum]
MIAATSPDSRTAHLQPVIDFLKARGNQPAGVDAWAHDRDGLKTYAFARPLDIAALEAHFEFPPAIIPYPKGIFDKDNFAQITYDTWSGVNPS